MTVEARSSPTGRPAVGRRGPRPYGVVQLAFGVALLGNAVGATGFPLFVLAATGSLSATGSVVTVAVLASVATGMLMGPLLDRWGMRRSWLLSTAVSAGSTALVVVLHAVDALPVAVLLPLTFLTTAAGEPGRVASFGMLPALARESHRTLERANATLRSSAATAAVLGPVLSAGLVVATGPASTLVLEAALAALATLVVGAVLRRHGGDREVRDGTASYRAQLAEAARFCWRDRLLRTLVLAVAAFSALDTALAGIGLIAYGERTLGASSWYGPMVAAFGVGALAGAVGFGVVGHRLSRRGVVLGCYLTIGVLVGVLAVQDEPLVALALLFVAGVVVSPVDLLFMIVLQERVPTRLFGGVASLSTTLVAVPGPAGVAAVSWLLVTTDVRTVLLTMAGCYVVTACALLPLRRLRGLGRAAGAHDTPAPTNL